MGVVTYVAKDNTFGVFMENSQQIEEFKLKNISSKVLRLSPLWGPEGLSLLRPALSIPRETPRQKLVATLAHHALLSLIEGEPSVTKEIEKDKGKAFISHTL